MDFEDNFDKLFKKSQKMMVSAVEAALRVISGESSWEGIYWANLVEMNRTIMDDCTQKRDRRGKPYGSNEKDNSRAANNQSKNNESASNSDDEESFDFKKLIRQEIKIPKLLVDAEAKPGRGRPKKVVQTPEPILSAPPKSSMLVEDTPDITAQIKRVDAPVTTSQPLQMMSAPPKCLTPPPTDLSRMNLEEFKQPKPRASATLTSSGDRQSPIVRPLDSLTTQTLLHLTLPQMKTNNLQTTNFQMTYTPLPKQPAVQKSQPEQPKLTHSISDITIQDELALSDSGCLANQKQKTANFRREVEDQGSAAIQANLYEREVQSERGGYPSRRFRSNEEHTEISSVNCQSETDCVYSLEEHLNKLATDLSFLVKNKNHPNKAHIYSETLRFVKNFSRFEFDPEILAKRQLGKYLSVISSLLNQINDSDNQDYEKLLPEASSLVSRIKQQVLAYVRLSNISTSQVLRNLQLASVPTTLTQ